MKLLFDEHLSHKLVLKLSDIFPNSKHVKGLELQSEDDLKIWELLCSNKSGQSILAQL